MGRREGRELVHLLFDEQVARTPEIPAIEFNGSCVTYAELKIQTDILAGALRRLGIGPDDRVPICLERGFDMMVAVLGVLKAGGAYVPLDPAYPTDRLEFMLTDARAKVVLTQSSLARRIPPTEAKMLLLDSWSGEGMHPVTLVNDGEPTDDSLAYVIYTSGSTGKPKGVAMVHRALTNLILWHRRALPLKPGDRTLQFTSLSFDVSFQEIFTTWAEGGTLVLMKEELRRDPRALWNYLIEQNVSRLYLPFVALQQLAEAAEGSAMVPGELREVITAGEQLQCTAKLQSLFKRLRGARLHNHYGPSETHVVTSFTLPPDVAMWPPLPPIGKAIDRTTPRILGENRELVRRGEPGELYMGGECLARGYLDRPDLTNERFVPDPFSVESGARLYRTGDLCRELEDGNIEYLGRIDTPRL